MSEYWSTKRSRVRDRFFTKYSTCFYCNIKLDQENRTVDHFAPLSKSGSKAKQNWRACCKDCNTAKGDKLDFVFSSRSYCE